MLQLLLGPDAAGFLDAALREYDADLVSVRVCEANVAPSGGARVRYQCRVRHPDGEVVDEVFVAATGDGIPDGAAVIAGAVEGAPVEIGLWRWPHDPLLPGLAIAADPARLADMLRTSGVTLRAVPRLAVRSYRPGQRAVLEVSDGNSRWFVKVVAPQAVDALRLRHSLLADALPVPPILASDDDGVVMLPAMSGTIVRLDHDPPKPAALQQILDELPEALMSLPSRPRHLQRIRQSLDVLELTLGPLNLDEFRSLPVQPGTACVPVHGDFHDGQILSSGGLVTGVLDIDTAGPGERADEWATMLGHLSVRGIRNTAARDYAETVFAHAADQCDAADLQMRTAAVVLGLANGPFRAQRPDWPEQARARIALAHEWLRSVKEHSSSVPAPLM